MFALPVMLLASFTHAAPFAMPAPAIEKPTAEPVADWEHVQFSLEAPPSWAEVNNEGRCSKSQGSALKGTQVTGWATDGFVVANPYCVLGAGSAITYCTDDPAGPHFASVASGALHQWDYVGPEDRKGHLEGIFKAEGEGRAEVQWYGRFEGAYGALIEYWSNTHGEGFSLIDDAAIAGEDQTVGSYGFTATVLGNGGGVWLPMVFTFTENGPMTMLDQDLDFFPESACTNTWVYTFRTQSLVMVDPEVGTLAPHFPSVGIVDGWMEATGTVVLSDLPQEENCGD